MINATTLQADINKEIVRLTNCLICSIDRLVPEDGTPVRLNAMHRFINDDTFQGDALRVDSVRRDSPGGHRIVIAFRGIDYSKCASDASDVYAGDENLFTDPEEETLQCSEPDPEKVALYKTVFDALARAVSNPEKRMWEVTLFNKANPKEKRVELVAAPDEQTAERWAIGGLLDGWGTFKTVLIGN